VEGRSAPTAHNVLFAVHDWGLGHATRDLPLIRALVGAGHEVTVMSTGRALRLLREELGADCSYVSLRDIPKPLGRHAFWFYVRMSLAIPVVFWTFRRERRFVDALRRTRGFDRIISDSRYGVCSTAVPSYYIVHSLRQIIPGRPHRLEMFVEAAQRYLLRGARKLIIPDEADGGLAGELCHDLNCSWTGRLEYIGIVCSVRRQELPHDVDYFVSVSGAEPQRTIFERLVLAQVHELPGRVVVALGKPESAAEVADDGRVAVHGYMDRRRQEEMMNRARLVITRSGYTTLMELAELRQRALLVPTVGQSEQEYLAARLERLGQMHAVAQPSLELARDARRAEAYQGLAPLHPTEESVRRFLRIVAA
jgi:UDP:flavonoid glycosyltransferase YjiC (YdhE family)